jgi:lipopolysaccharide export system permease protein
MLGLEKLRLERLRLRKLNLRRLGLGSLRIRTLDRYIVGNWIRIFILTALGFPIVSIMINLTDTLNRLLDRGLTMKEIAISYVYSIPENAFIVMPAAVLFATVFTVGAS